MKTEKLQVSLRRCGVSKKILLEVSISTEEELLYGSSSSESFSRTVITSSLTDYKSFVSRIFLSFLHLGYDFMGRFSDECISEVANEVERLTPLMAGEMEVVILTAKITTKNNYTLSVIDLESEGKTIKGDTNDNR